MNVTTIRVEPAVRDRLAARAAAHGRSLSAELDAILRDLDWQVIEAAYRRLAERPADLATYLANAESITAVGLEELAATAAEEYPEYNP